MPAPLRIPAGPDPSVVAWGKTQQYCDKLFDALEELHEAGGSTRTSAVCGWSDKAREKALATMKAAHSALGEEIARLEARAKHFPARRRRIG